MEETAKTRIVCMGDSNTEGFGLGEDSSVFYPETLNSILGDNYEVINKGVTASCMTLHEENGVYFGMPYMKQAKYQEALDANGDIYVVMHGTNDASDGYDPQTKQKIESQNMIAQIDDFTPSYQKLINDIKAINADARIILVAPIPILECIWPKHQEKYLLKLIPKIQKLAKDNNIEFANIHEDFENTPYDHLLTLYQKDGLHLNVTGAMVLASIMANYVTIRH